MKLERNYFFLLVFPIVLILPFPLIVSSISMAAACLNLLILFFIEKKSKRTNDGVFLIFFGLYIVLLDSVANLFREMNFDLVFKESRMAFFVIPLVLWIGQNQLLEIRKKLLEGIVVGVFLYILYSFGFLIYFYSFLTNRSFAFNQFLKYDLYNYLPGAYHHAYIGMYMTFALIIITNNLISIKKSIILFIALIVFACQVFIGGNLSIVLSFIVLCVFIVKQIKLKRAVVRWGLLFSVGAILVVGYFSGVFETISFSVSNRLESWKCSLFGFLDNPLAGLGDNTFSYLSNCISSDAISTHNQYLNELVTYGIFGGWIFMLFFLLYKRLYINEISKYYILLIIILCFTENILSLQRGILFFTFFTSLFIYTNLQND